MASVVEPVAEPETQLPYVHVLIDCFLSSPSVVAIARWTPRRAIVSKCPKAALQSPSVPQWTPPVPVRNGGNVTLGMVRFSVTPAGPFILTLDHASGPIIVTLNS